MSRLTALFAFGALLACGKDPQDPFTPYALGQALVVGPDPGGTPARLEAACDDEGGSSACREAVENCGDRAYAELVLDEQRNLLDVICYPGNVTVREIGVETVESASAGNHTVLVLDDVADGADISGDVTLTGNGAIVYGNGADVSSIGGQLAIDKNNAIVRGVGIDGSVTISKNNATLAFCEIGGDLTIQGNNATVAECIVHGQVRIEGNNAVFVRNQLGENDALSGKNLSCNANVSFEQPQTGEPVSSTEPAALVPCDGG